MNFNEHLCDLVGETVTIFTTSGGVSGCGFTGFLIFVGPCFVSLLTQVGSAPDSPLSGPLCNGFEDIDSVVGHGKQKKHFRTGTVCDIPVDKIASFCHNAI